MSYNLVLILTHSHHTFGVLEFISKVIDHVIRCHPELDSGLFQDPYALIIRPRTKFGVTGLSSFLTFKTASKTDLSDFPA